MNTELSVYDKINSMAEITSFGGAMAAIMQCSPPQGVAMAVQCMFERKPPLEMAKTYHLVGGKLVKRADAMLADLRRAGGKWKWADLENPTRQEATVTWEGEEYQVSYSIEQAKAAGYVKAGSNWTNDPAPMLRARLVSRTLRAIAPELVQGMYTEADLDGVDSSPAPDSGNNEPRNVTPIDRAQAAMDKQRTATAQETQPIEAEVVSEPVAKPARAISAADDPFTSPTDAATDYNIIPVGPNKGKQWIDLDRATLERVLANPGPLTADHISAVSGALERLPF